MRIYQKALDDAIKHNLLQSVKVFDSIDEELEFMLWELMQTNEETPDATTSEGPSH